MPTVTFHLKGVCTVAECLRAEKDRDFFDPNGTAVMYAMLFRSETHPFGSPYGQVVRRRTRLVLPRNYARNLTHLKPSPVRNL